MSIYNNIRQALETKLNAVAGIPTVYFENVKETPTTGTPYVTCRLIPAVRTPAVMGTSPQQQYTGSFMVLVHYPENQGPGTAETMVNTIITDFDATTDINDAGIILSIRRAERMPGYNRSPWYVIPIDISWYIYN
jgi:hypothetical protein